MIWTLIWLIAYVPVTEIKIPETKVSVSIEYCENLYFTDFELFENNSCNLELVEKRIRQAKGIE